MYILSKISGLKRYISVLNDKNCLFEGTFILNDFLKKKCIIPTYKKFKHVINTFIAPVSIFNADNIFKGTSCIFFVKYLLFIYIFYYILPVMMLKLLPLNT